MTNWNKLEIQQLDWDPEGPLCFLHVPENFTDVIVNALRRFPLHGSHGSVIQGVGNPRPVNKLKGADELASSKPR